VTAVLRKPRTFVLLVEAVRQGRLVIVGLLPLGRHRTGTSRIHRNLRVNGRPLGSAGVRRRGQRRYVRGARDGGSELYAARENADRRATKGPLAGQDHL
jgi:hypothetical protein